MKHFFVLTLALSLTLTASAEIFKAEQHKGKAVAYDQVDANKSVIAITGKAALKVYNDMDDSLIQGLTDASENNGTQVVQKVGKNLTCTAFIKSGKETKVTCEISLEDKKAGIVGQGGVG
jgi:hypothetical protein